MIKIMISDLKAEDEGTYYCHLGADPAIKMPVHLLVDGWKLLLLTSFVTSSSLHHHSIITLFTNTIIDVMSFAVVTVIFFDIITMITSLQNYRTWPKCTMKVTELGQFGCFGWFE